jgi:hypothetical protein
LTRRPLYALAALLAVAAGVAFYSWRRGPSGVTTPPTNADVAAATTPGVVIVDATPLPAAFESPGLVSRRLGPLRLYVSVAPEVALTKTADLGKMGTGNVGGSQPEGERLASVPIRVVLENDSYREVDARRDLSLDGEELFQVSVSGADSGVVFSESRSAEETVWEPAERKTFDVAWRPGGAPPGEYVVAVKLAFGGPGEVKIRTRLK